MQKFINNPDTLTAEMLEGLALAHSELVSLELGKLVVNRKLAEADRVTIVALGGSGYEPALSGFVGEGMLDWVAIQRTVAAMPQELLLIIETKPLKPALHYEMDPRFAVQNVERNCMKFEFAEEQQLLLEKIRRAGFKHL